MKHKGQLTTATAGESIISRGVTVVKYATFARTYTTVTNEHEIHDAFGRFLHNTINNISFLIHSTCKHVQW